MDATLLRTFFAIILLLLFSCNKNDETADNPNFHVALPSPPVKVKNTDGTWLVYEMHIKAPNLEKTILFNNDNLILSYTDFISKHGFSTASIWLQYPASGWEDLEIKHEFHYRDTDGHQQQSTFILDIEEHYPDPITIDFPVPSGIWLAEGAPGVNSYHTRALFPFDEPVFDPDQNGYLIGNNPQRYAIDYAKLVDGLPYVGDGSSLEDWHCYNLPILAAQSGKVIFTKDGIPDNQTPFELDYPTDMNNATGNVVYIEHADGTIGNYSHLKPNSITVTVGDMVAIGQEIGRLGNSGNSFAPHLHMHLLTNPEGKSLQEYPDGLFMESLPYKFGQFTKLGTAPVEYMDLNPIYPFVPIEAEVFNNTIPSESDVIEF